MDEKNMRSLSELCTEMYENLASEHDILQEKNKIILKLLRDILNSDMAMREEDEGEVSELLERVREIVK